MSTLSKIIADREIAATKAELEAKRKPKKRLQSETRTDAMLKKK